MIGDDSVAEAKIERLCSSRYPSGGGGWVLAMSAWLLGFGARAATTWDAVGIVPASTRQVKLLDVSCEWSMDAKTTRCC